MTGSLNDIIFTDEIIVEVLGSVAADIDVVAAAQVSVKGSAVTSEMYDDEKTIGLVNFLMKNRHGTPFEHTFFRFFVDAPIFVFREFHRHRIGWSYNEESGRYKELRGKFYIPNPQRNLVQVGKPGAYNFTPGDPGQYQTMLSAQKRAYRVAYGEYLSQLNAGIAKEVARMVLPVSTYSSMYATCNARSLMAFLSLRQKRSPVEAVFPSQPMAEINRVADQMEQFFSAAMPHTHAAFVANGYVAP